MQERSNRVKAKLPSGYVMTPEQERSMLHMEAGTICKCGHKETKVLTEGVHLYTNVILFPFSVLIPYCYEIYL